VPPICHFTKVLYVIFYKALYTIFIFQILGTKPEETLVFEDALFAIKTAEKANFKVVGVYRFCT